MNTEETTTASDPLVLSATNKLYEAALLIRQVPGITATDIRDYLQGGLIALQTQVVQATERAKVPAIERPAPSIIQRGPDPAADLLRAHARGERIELR